MTSRIIHFKLKDVGPFESFIQTQVNSYHNFTSTFIYLFSCPQARQTSNGQKLGIWAYLLLILYALWQKKHPLLPTTKEPIHAHFGSNAILALPFSLLTQSPLITSFYGHDYSSFPRKSIWHKLIIRIVLKYSQTVVAMTPFMAEKLVQLHCPKEKISIFQPGAMPINYIKPPVTKVENLLMVCSLRAKKNHRLVLKALHLLQNKHPKLKLVLLGTGPLEEELKNLVQKLNLQDQVHFAGLYQQTEELIFYYEKADLFLHPSITADNGCMEGFPTAIWEALSVGLPVICTKHANIDEYIADYAIFVDEYNAELLAENIDNLIQNPQVLPEMQKKGRAFYHQLFATEKLIKSREDMYRNAVSHTKPFPAR